MGELLDRDVVTRVLRRASELSDDADPDVDGIDEEALVEAADEVGIPVAAVRRAIAAERLGPVPAGRAGDVVLGPAVVVVDAELPGHAVDAMRRLDGWLVAGHHLRRARRRDGPAVWTKRTGLVGTTLRTVRSATGEGRLGRLRRVVATACDTGTGTCMLRIEADRSAQRRTIAGEGAIVATVGTAGVLLAAAVAAPAVLVAAPIAVLAGVGVAARGRARAGPGRAGGAARPRRRRSGPRPDAVGDRPRAPGRRPAVVTGQRSRRSTSSWSRPFVLIAVPASWVATPWRSVNRPPASSTRRRTAATS